MSGIDKPDRKSITDLDLIMILAGNEVLQYPHRIFHVVHRCHFRLTGTPRLTVSPLRLKFLNVCGILEHDVTEFTGCLRREYLPPESVAIQQRQQSGMIDMRMRDKDIINRCRIHRNLLIHIQIRSLLHTTIHQKMRFPKRHIVAASRHLTVSA